MNEHLKPDEIEMLSRAEKATKGPWIFENHLMWATPSPPNIQTAPGIGNDIARVKSDGGETWGTVGKYEIELRNAAFIAAARTDLPTILARLANERAKLAIAIAELKTRLAAFDREAQVAHARRAFSLSTVWHEEAEYLRTALAAVNELEKQHGKT